MQFEGQDKMMILTSPILQRANTVSCSLITQSNQDFIYTTIVKRIKLALRNITHLLRARQNMTELQEYYYDEQPSSILSKQIVQKCDKPLTHLDLGKILVKSEMSAIIRVYQNTIFIAATHLFVDGVHFAEIIGICMDNHVVDFNIIPTFDYVPFITEASIIPGIIGSLKSLSNRRLSVDSRWKTNVYPIQLKYYTNQLCNTKRIRKYLVARYNKFGFTATIATISGIYTFENITKNEINIGIVAAFQNNKRFNNFSAFIIQLKRPNNWSSISLIDKVNDISYQIHLAVESYGKSSVITNYLITNVYNMNIYTNDMVDVLVSCAPSTGRCVFNGKDAELNNMEMYGTSMPLYMGFWTSNDNVKSTITSRSNDIDLNKKDTLQIDEMCKIITI